MTRGSIVIEGETFISIEVAADCFELRVQQVRAAYDLGILGTGREWQGRTWIAAAMLDRLAEAVRWQRLGMDLEAVAVLLMDLD